MRRIALAFLVACSSPVAPVVYAVDPPAASYVDQPVAPPVAPPVKRVDTVVADAGPEAAPVEVHDSSAPDAADPPDVDLQGPPDVAVPPFDAGFEGPSTVCRITSTPSHADVTCPTGDVGGTLLWSDTGLHYPSVNMGQCHGNLGWRAFGPSGLYPYNCPVGSKCTWVTGDLVTVYEGTCQIP